MDMMLPVWDAERQEEEEEDEEEGTCGGEQTYMCV
jgi:hypothetical protein